MQAVIDVATTQGLVAVPLASARSLGIWRLVLFAGMASACDAEPGDEFQDRGGSLAVRGAADVVERQQMAASSDGDHDLDVAAIPASSPGSPGGQYAADLQPTSGFDCLWERQIYTSGTTATLECPAGRPAAAGSCWAASTSHRLTRSYAIEAPGNVVDDEMATGDTAGWQCQWGSAATAQAPHYVAALCCPGNGGNWERLDDLSGVAAYASCDAGDVALGGTCYAASSSHLLSSDYGTEAVANHFGDPNDPIFPIYGVDEVDGWGCEWDTAATGSANKHIVATQC